MQRRTFAAAGLTAACWPAAQAQSWPARPIKTVQGFAAGGNADTIAREIGRASCRERVLS